MEVKKYSKLKLVLNLRTRSMWTQFKEWLVGSDYYDAFMAAQYMSSDHPLFQTLFQQAQEALGISGDLAMEILAECEDDDNEVEA